MNVQTTYYPNETNEYQGKYIQIRFDDVDTDPRKDWDHAATMACRHRRYNLGDGDLSKLYEALSSDPGWQDQYGDHYSDDYIDPDDAVGMYDLACKFGFEILPVFLYDHSGLSISTSGFSCPWDSGQVGYIFMSKKDMRECYLVKRVTGKVRERARELMVGEVKEYDHYLRGECYGYVVCEDEDCTVVLDSCWGFIGDLSYVSEEAREVVKLQQSE